MRFLPLLNISLRFLLAPPPICIPLNPPGSMKYGFFHFLQLLRHQGSHVNSLLLLLCPHHSCCVTAFRFYGVITAWFATAKRWYGVTIACSTTTCRHHVTTACLVNADRFNCFITASFATTYGRYSVATAFFVNAYRCYGVTNAWSSTKYIHHGFTDALSTTTSHKIYNITSG